MQPGITSYKHLNEVIFNALVIRYEKNKDREIERHEMTARSIQDWIVTHYKTDKVRINGVKIAKRLKGVAHVVVRHGKDGLCYYRYDPN